MKDWLADSLPMLTSSPPPAALIEALRAEVRAEVRAELPRALRPLADAIQKLPLK